MHKNYYLLGSIVAISASCSRPKAERPNILLIMADDVGISDIGCYGSEIKTPNINKLANEGLRFRSFYSMSKSNPTRSSMLTGLYNGGNGAVHLAHLTKLAGYNNIMSGKEHFDSWVPEYCKAQYVFDQSFHFWATTEYFKPPGREFEESFYLNGKELKAKEIEYEQSPMYKTDFITDYALKWLKGAVQEERPFFLYLPYHAAHYPLQARPEDIEKYRGTYLKGWEKVRAERYKRMQRLGVLPPNTRLSAAEKNLNRYRGPLVPEYTDCYSWDGLNALQKDSLDLEMAVFAAMVDRMDQNIGRVLKLLEKHNKLENTLVMFLCDNGSCPFYTNKIKDVQPGPDSSYWSLRAAWANVGNTPYRQYKQAGYEGGSHSPFIAYWPKVISSNSYTDQVGHVVDIAPTFLDVLGIEYPDSIHGHKTIPLHGASLFPVFEGKQRETPAFFISGLERFRMFRQSDYKIVKMNDGDWELYDMDSDPSETNNLASVFPYKVDSLENSYNRVKRELFTK